MHNNYGNLCQSTILKKEMLKQKLSIRILSKLKM